MQMQLRRTLSTLRPFSHLMKAKKSSPRDSGPDDSVDQDERDAGPNEDVGDEGDSGPDKKNDKLKNKPIADEDNDDAEGDDDPEGGDDDDEADDEKDEKAVRKARAAGHARALAAMARQARRAERTRCASIFGSRHAQGRIEQAANLAFHSLLSASAAITALSRTPLAHTTSISSTPGQRLLAATTKLADEQLGRRATERMPFSAEDRAMRHRLEFAHEKLKAVGSKHGHSLLDAVARVPPPPRGF